MKGQSLQGKDTVIFIMDDMSAKLNQILSDPQSMNQIKNIMDSMGLGGNHSAEPAVNNSPPPPAPVPAAIPTTDMISTITRFAPLLSKVQQEDDSTRLLNALRPMLSPPRQKKVDEAMKIIRILRLLPLVKDTGILGSLFG